MSFYEGLKVLEAHVYVFYVSGKLPGGLVSVVACEGHPGVYGKEATESNKLANILNWFDVECTKRVKEMMANLAVTCLKVKVQDEDFRISQQGPTQCQSLLHAQRVGGEGLSTRGF